YFQANKEPHLKIAFKLALDKQVAAIRQHRRKRFQSLFIGLKKAFFFRHNLWLIISEIKNSLTK
ncbi:MAG: hypothetical protein LDL01_05250, partial [Ignavibacterium sp.]|nr:hypothetical protein [Ignavibacterium sp.]